MITVSLLVIRKKEIIFFIAFDIWVLFYISAESYVKHPNSYLPKYNVQSETDGETTPLNGKMDESTADSNAYESDEEFYDDEDEQIGSIWNYSKKWY